MNFQFIHFTSFVSLSLFTSLSFQYFVYGWYMRVVKEEIYGKTSTQWTYTKGVKKTNKHKR